MKQQKHKELSPLKEYLWQLDIASYKRLEAMLEHTTVGWFKDRLRMRMANIRARWPNIKNWD